jgi:WD40 repeat protein
MSLEAGEGEVVYLHLYTTISVFSSFAKGPIYCTLPNAQRGVPLVISGDPKGKNFLYTCGKSVVIRDIANPGSVDVYRQHSVPATVAKYSPSGFYIASGDESGKIRIWDTTQKEHILKNEYQPIAGKIKDIAWDPESKRIAICGEGREKFGHVFLWDTGSSVGEISGHSKFINSIDLKPSRPYRCVTAGEDLAIAWFEGPPFKYKKVIRDHSRFVNAIRFSPNGERVCSGGADGLAILLDGRTGDVLGKLGSDGKAHSGGIYAVSWSPDSTRVLTASGDKTCKVFDVETSQVVTEFKMGNAIEDQQVSCLWQGDYMLSVSVSGNINYLDKNNPNQPMRVLKGHNKNITAVECSSDAKTLHTGCYTGRVTHWEVDGNDQDVVKGKPHSNEIKKIQVVGEKVYTLGFDKTLKSFSNSMEFE